MAWTEQDYQEIVARLMAESIGVNEVPDAGSTDDISSLPAYQPANGTEVPTVVKASLELLVAPALDAADKANEAADKAESNATAAQTAANTANEKAELAAQAASDANAAKEEAEAATQSANNAASNAEEKAAAANTAAQNAEKVANNPTYIGKDHYVYVYNKDTESFDKTDIYCKGEPGSSFRVAGEYDTLEALKSAVPDGSAVDGFMAVGTEAPYDYYAWVNGEWVSQGKIGGIDEAPTDGKAYGRKNGNWAEVPEHLNLTSENLNDINGAGFATQKSTAGYTTPENNYPINENGALIFANAHYSRSNQIYGSYLTNRWFARGGGNQQGIRTDWKEFVFTGDVLTKTNTTEYTPTSDYNPAPKAYVDNSISNSRSVGYMMQLTEIDASGLDENTWYPVVMSLGNRYTVRIEVLVGLDSITTPSWSTHYNGFSVRKIWEVNGDGWGTSHVNRQIFVSDYKFADIDPVRGVGQLTNFSNEYVFVRGGGKYHFYTSHNTIPVLKTEIFVDEGGASISPTTETPAEIVVNMATKKYVDEQMFLLTISNTGHQELVSNQDTTGETAATKINTVFGSADNFKSVVSQLMANKRLVIKITETERFQPGVIYSYMNTDNGSYELSFDFNYSSLSSTGATLLSKRIFIAMNNNYGNFFIVRDIVTSDNLTTITKKTAAEYEGIGSKDANTAYCVTD